MKEISETTKYFISKAVKLFMNNPWLCDRESQVYKLLGECESNSEIDLLLDLLGRFTYLGADEYKKSFESIANQVVNVWGLDPVSTQIAAISWDDLSDSGQFVLHALKPSLSRLGGGAYPLVSKANKVNSLANRCPNIVLVDEFFGTGQTIKIRADYIRKNWPKHLTKPEIYVAMMAGMRAAKFKFSHLVRDVYVCNELEKGITGHYAGDELDNARYEMSRLEGRLAEKINGKNLPFCGYGAAEALFGSETNIPNSVFPVFWWPELRSGALRETLFRRYE
ncbi:MULTISPECIES: hypothetical protein [unclassified Burkholderia]|uniref:phosphoribosyltransferase-like protein n=1 Tax=unclassified Burkholderia TaxID=2613784 RepID=UPI002AB0738E|nr:MULTISPECIES: hypothetical protein [unclassified Burkholderia]